MSSSELWVALSTLVFAIVVWRPGKRALLGGIDARRAAIVRDLEEAKRLREEAEKLLLEAKERHRTASGEAVGLVAFARDEAQRLRDEAEADMRRHVNRRERQATDRIAQAEASAIAEIRARAADLAVAASRHMLRTKLTGEAGERLADDVIASLPGKLSAKG